MATPEPSEANVPKDEEPADVALQLAHVPNLAANGLVEALERMHRESITARERQDRESMQAEERQHREKMNARRHYQTQKLQVRERQHQDYWRLRSACIERKSRSGGVYMRRFRKSGKSSKVSLSIRWKGYALILRASSTRWARYAAKSRAYKKDCLSRSLISES
ncbi:hypothetical protein IEO21_06827 [Rhodonia placenta]|uniref:Uncharacterized protein n=1 Tax=Rhodonia placenta TaxID=104341 RepID=A0A8H7U092_9APHY|nr:hypothetical protein IEO21_06827 [Postia placenta]